MLKITPQPIEVSARQLMDLLITAFEGDCNYWVSQVNIIDQITGRAIDYRTLADNADEQLLRRTVFEITTYDPDYPEPPTKHSLRIDDFQRGLQLMSDEFSTHFQDFVKGNDDAITADLFLQCVIFKKVIYG